MIPSICSLRDRASSGQTHLVQQPDIRAEISAQCRSHRSMTGPMWPNVQTSRARCTARSAHAAGPWMPSGSSVCFPAYSGPYMPPIRCFGPESAA